MNMLNEEFLKNLEQMEPARREQTLALMRAIGSPPERILDLLDRVGIHWERKNIDGQSCLVAPWAEVVEGEKRNQEQGPVLKRLMEEGVFQQPTEESATGSQIVPATQAPAQPTPAPTPQAPAAEPSQAAQAPQNEAQNEPPTQ